MVDGEVNLAGVEKEADVTAFPETFPRHWCDAPVTSEGEPCPECERAIRAEATFAANDNYSSEFEEGRNDG